MASARTICRRKWSERFRDVASFGLGTDGRSAAVASQIDTKYALAQDEGPIKIGWLGDRTGDFSVVGVQKFNAANLAVKELNDAGGVLGRELTLVAEDAQSDNRRYQEMARKLIPAGQGRCPPCLLHLRLTRGHPADRRPEQDALLLQQPVRRWRLRLLGVPYRLRARSPGCPIRASVMKLFGPRFYTIAADYNFGQLTADWFKKTIEQQGGQVIGEEFIPLDVSQFSTSITNIQNAAPDVLIVLLVGIKQSSFYEQKNSAGMQVPMATTINMGQGYEHLRFPPPALNNMYVTVNFMQELAKDLNTDFPDRVRALYPDAEYVGMEAAAEYEGINLYALAAEKAGTTDKDAIRQALETNITFDGPGGPVTIDPATHHTVRNIYLVHADEEHNIILDDTFEAVRPDWLSKDKGCNLPEKPDNTQYEP